MNRRAAFLSLAVVSLVVLALPQASLAQSSSLLGTWTLNLEKSKFVPGTAPKSQTNTYQQDGQNLKGTTQAAYAEGNTITTGLMHIYDGQPHPVTGNPVYDSRSYAKVDANTLVSASTKAGKLVQVANIVISQDGKTFTTTTSGILDASGRVGTNIAVYDKQ